MSTLFNASPGGNSGQSKSNTPNLDKHSQDLTALAEKNNLDPLIGREAEVYRISQILSRRKKNNPIILGEPGVGKTAIAEGLAQRIVNKEVPRSLLKKRIVSLDITSIISGTKFRGEFEERMKAITKELESNPQIIVFIDEVHNIIGAGNVSGGVDASNILKPALARGKLQLIGATTSDEFKKIIENDGALVRRFHTVNVKQTTVEDTISVLENIKDRYEDYHSVEYTKSAIEACVHLSERYLKNKMLPDKAIDLMDEAGSRKHMQKIVVPNYIKEKEEELKQINKYKIDYVNNQEYELAAQYRDKESKLQEEIDNQIKEWEQSLNNNKFTVDYTDIAQTISNQTGIPIEEIDAEKVNTIKNMPKVLKEKVIGQDKGVDAVTQVIKRSKTGVSDYNKPMGSFIFLGPTGVGKTMLAKELANYLFDDAKESFIRFDMSEFQEKFNVSQLVGAPPGYVGYQNGGQLTEAVRNKPHSVILLDEIEKAHTDIFNTLLQLLDEGRLSDSDGKFVDFTNTIIIMTSNIGAKKVEDYGTGVGFSTSSGESEKEAKDKIIKKELKKKFKPEFINRLDALVSFDQLDKESISNIVGIELEKFNNRISFAENYSFKFTKQAKEFLAEKGYDPKYGARPLKRAIEEYVENIVADAIVDNKLKKGSVRTIAKHKNEDKLYIK